MPRNPLPTPARPQYMHISGTTTEGATVDLIAWCQAVGWTYSPHEFKIQPNASYLETVTIRFVDGSTLTLDAKKSISVDSLEETKDLPEDMDRILVPMLERALAFESLLFFASPLDMNQDIRKAAEAILEDLRLTYHAVVYAAREANDVLAHTDMPEDQFNAGTIQTAEAVLAQLRAGLTEGKEPQK